MKLAYEHIKNGVSVSDDFKSEIAKHIVRHKPMVIIETGTHTGLGTTDAAIRGLVGGGHGGILISIEANRAYIDAARRYHARYEGAGYVRFMHGVSLPEEWMPHEIDDDFPEHVYTDHVNSKEYLKEIPAQSQYDMLGIAMREFDFKIDMFILDSAGYLGTAEYLYIIDKQRSPCYFFLDDTLHRKHYKTMQIIEKDSRCKIIEKSREKFGHAIVHYKPNTLRLHNTAGKDSQAYS